MLGWKKINIRLMAQDFGVFGVEFDNFTIEELDKKMEEKIEKLQNWLRNAKYTDSFIKEFQTMPVAFQETHLFNQPKVISNFRTLLYEYRTLRNWFVYKNKPMQNLEEDKITKQVEQSDSIQMKDCNYSINPSQYRIEHILQGWFTELSYPMRSFITKKFKEYSENDLFYIKVGKSFRGRPWFMDFDNYEDMERFLVEYSSPCTIDDLQKKLDLIIAENTVYIKNTGNEFLNSIAINVAQIRRECDINSLKLFIDLIKAGRIKPSLKDAEFKKSMESVVKKQQSDFESKRKAAIDYLETIKPSKIKTFDYCKNELFDENNDAYNVGGLTESILDGILFTNGAIQEGRLNRISKSEDMIECYYSEFDSFLEQIDLLNDLISAGREDSDSISNDEIYSKINMLMNSFIDDENLEVVEKLRKSNLTTNLAFSLIKWSDEGSNVEVKTVEELREEKEQIVNYTINSDSDDIDLSSMIPLIENIYGKYEMVRGIYDYVNQRKESDEIYSNISGKK